MLTWLKRILGFAPVESRQEPLVLAQEMRIEETTEETPKATTTQEPKPTTTNKEAAVDLTSMKKNELLAHAKKIGAKANAGMKKEDIIAAINAS